MVEEPIGIMGNMKKFARHFNHLPAFLLLSGLVMIVPWETPTVTAGSTPVSLAPSDDDTETRVTLNIKTRTFDPETITLTPNQKTRLTIINHDSELHAFVPVGLLSHTHINLSGNGAPQFGKEGLLRVLLPTRGRADIVFIPTRPGNYPFFCDLPGHVMRGNIMVQEK